MDLWTSPTDRREPCGPCGQPVDNADALPTACPHSRASRPQAPQDQPPVILRGQHRTTLRRGCLHRPFKTTSACHSNRSQHRPRPGSPPSLQAHFRMGLDCPDTGISRRDPEPARSPKRWREYSGIGKANASRAPPSRFTLRRLPGPRTIRPESSDARPRAGKRRRRVAGRVRYPWLPATSCALRPGFDSPAAMHDRSGSRGNDREGALRMVHRESPGAAAPIGDVTVAAADGCVG